MKKLLSLLLALLLGLLPILSLAEGEEEGDEDLVIEEVVEETIPPDVAPENVYVDEDTGETFYLNEQEQQKLDGLIEAEPEEDLSVDPDSLDMNPNLPGNVINILLIGVDTRSDNPLEIVGRGDTEIIVSVNLDTGAIKMTSILRDSYVAIPGYRNKTKINNAFQYGCNRVKSGEPLAKTKGGAALAMRTINKNFEMNIQYYVAINFNGLASIVDAIGGVDIDLTKGEAWYINKYLKDHPPAYDNKAKGERTPLEVRAGLQHLDGVQAVMFARTRSLKGENDLNRTDRQRRLLDILLKYVLSNMDATMLMDLIGTATDYAATNMNFETIWKLVTSLYPVLTKGMEEGTGDSAALFEQMRIPDKTETRSFKYDTKDGSSVLTYNVKKHTQALHEFVYGSYIPAKAK